MLIEITNIKDTGCIKYDDQTASKLFLMEEILKIFTPLFSAEIDRKQQQFESNKRDFVELATTNKQIVDELKQLKNESQREKLIASILNKIKILIDGDFLYGNNKKIVLDIFQGLQSGVSTKDLELQVNELTELIQKAKQ
jgi:hypothetical protein